MKLGFVGFGCLLFAVLSQSIAGAGESIDLSTDWRFSPDPDKSGVDKGWHLASTDDSAWASVRTGTRWEDQGYPDIDGVAWYRKRVTIPDAMRADRIWFAAGGLNDSGAVYCNGELVATFGDEESTSVARTPVVAELTKYIQWGRENLIAIRAFDWGGSGGLAQDPCILTTDYKSLPIHNLIHFAPGFEGGRSIIGVEIGQLGVTEDSAIRLGIAVNDAPYTSVDAKVALDREGRHIAVAAVDLSPKAGDAIRLTAEVSPGGSPTNAPFRLERTYTWPGQPAWPGEYSRLRVLNNFVTVLCEDGNVPDSNGRYTFPNPREGWVFIRIQGKDEGQAFLDDEDLALVWRKHPDTGALEAMRYLEAGKHQLRLENARGAKLDVRAVPEIAFCYWPTTTVLKALPPRDRAFADRYIFPNTNTLLTRDDMTDEEFASWKAEGRHWLSNSSLPGIDDEKAPTADAVYQDWAGNACVTRPGYSGLIVDEFLSSPPEHYAAWTNAMERLYENPGFKGQTYNAWVVDTYQHKPGLAFMRRLYELGGRFAWERYIHEEPSEEVAVLRIYEELGALEEWNALMPGLKERLTYCLGSFSIPWCSLNINPAVDFLPFMDRQFQVLATDPLFFGSRGIFQWAEHYTDDDVLRYALKLYRHYCIEGNRTPCTDDPYLLSHIENPDFLNGLDGWTVEPAAAGAVTPGKHRGLGKIQGRWANIGIGDACATMVRDGAAPNRIRQTVRNLKPGRVYSMKFIAADLDNLGNEAEVGLWPALEGAEMITEHSYRYIMPSSYALDLDGFDRDHRAYTTYCHLLFKATSDAAEVTFSDWKDGKPAGPVGQRIGFNFVEIQPYYE